MSVAVEELNALTADHGRGRARHLVPRPDPRRQEGHRRRSGRAGSWRSMATDSGTLKDLPGLVQEDGPRVPRATSRTRGYLRLFLRKMK